MGLFNVIGYLNLHDLTIDNKKEHYVAEININVKSKYNESQGSETTSLKVPISKREYEILRKQLSESEFPNTYLKIEGTLELILANNYESIKDKKIKITEKQIQERIIKVVRTLERDCSLDDLKDLILNVDRKSIRQGFLSLMDKGKAYLTWKRKISCPKE